jgi:hypothetical protein
MPVNRHHLGAAVGILPGIGFALDEVETPPRWARRSCTLYASNWVPARADERARSRQVWCFGDAITSVNPGESGSNDPAFSPGDLVVGQLGWQGIRKRPRWDAPAGSASSNLQRLRCTPSADRIHGVLRIVRIGKPRPGDTVVVSAAAVRSDRRRATRAAGCHGRHRGG